MSLRLLGLFPESHSSCFCFAQEQVSTPNSTVFASVQARWKVSCQLPIAHADTASCSACCDGGELLFLLLRSTATPPSASPTSSTAPTSAQATTSSCPSTWTTLQVRASLTWTNAAFPRALLLAGACQSLCLPDHATSSQEACGAAQATLNAQNNTCPSLQALNPQFHVQEAPSGPGWPRIWPQWTAP